MRALAIRTGLVGKAPCQADFVRINASSPLALELHRWLAAGVESARIARRELPSGPVSFLFTLPQEPHVLLGVLAPSTDGVGRAFPLALFTELPAATAARRLALLPAVYRSFLQEGAALLGDVTALDLPGLTARVDALAHPRPEAFHDAERLWRATLARRPAASWLALLRQPEDPPGGAYYALHTVRTACAGEALRQHGTAQVILDCPVEAELGAAVWLELTSRLLRWPSSPPAFLCTETPEPRLLLSLGAMPPDLLSHLTRPGPGTHHVWPLRTSRPAAIEQAARSLSAPQRQHIDSSTTALEELLHALAC